MRGQCERHGGRRTARGVRRLRRSTLGENLDENLDENFGRKYRVSRLSGPGRVSAGARFWEGHRRPAVAGGTRQLISVANVQRVAGEPVALCFVAIAQI